MERERDHADTPDSGERDSERRLPEDVPISVLFGSLKDKTTVRLTIEEINQAAADGWAGKLR
jgi:hypothetical protein